MSRITLSHMQPSCVMHPDDVSRLSWIRNRKGFETVLKKSIVRYQEAVAGVTYTGNGYEINAQSVPHLYAQLHDDCKILGIEEIPILSAFWEYFISSDSVGGTPNRIVLTSGAVDLLQNEELDFLLGHELGHIVCGHKPYQMLLEMLYSSFINDVDHFNLASIIKMPLLEWFRVSHYTADRMGLLCCQDINVAIRTMVKMSGCPKKYYDRIDTEAFLRQAEQFENSTSGTFTSLIKEFSVRSCSMPWLVVRAKKLNDWYKSGEYQQILDQH